METGKNADPGQEKELFPFPVTDESGYLNCGCCGELIRHTPEENAHFGIEPYPDDRGYGMCRACGGNPNAADFREQLGWAGRTFFEARFEVLRDALSDGNRAKFDGMSYRQKVSVITRLIENGALI